MLIRYPAGKTGTSYAIPDSVTSIDDDAFDGCTSIQSITIPNSVTEVCKYAFDGCSSLSVIYTTPNPSKAFLEQLRDVVGQEIKIKTYLETDDNKGKTGHKIAPNRDISDSKYQPVESPGVTFDDIVGLDEAKERIYRTIILPIERPDLFESMNLDTGDGILLYGPPGTGKTMFAQAVATEINAAFFSVKVSDIDSMHVGESENNIRELFETARAFDTAVIFFDEFDALGMSRDIGFNQDIYGRSITELLAQMQGFTRSPTTLILLAATNRPWDIDAALKRPGRFGCQVYIGLPDEQAREVMFEKQFSGVSVSDEVDFTSLAEATEGFNGADIKELCREIKMNSIIRNKNKKTATVIDRDVTEALKKVRPSVNTESLKRYEDYKENN